MSLSRIDRAPQVNPNESPLQVVAELCRVLNETVVKLVAVNNECVQLRQEVENLKQRGR